MSRKMRLVGGIAIAIGCVFLLLGFYKKSVYVEPGPYLEGRNAYFGIETYNYSVYNHLMNVGYFTAYSVLAGAFFIVGGIALSADVVCEELEKTRKQANAATEGDDSNIGSIWRCLKCGRNNPGYKDSCGCGRRRE